MCDMTHSHFWHDASTCTPWLPTCREKKKEYTWQRQTYHVWDRYTHVWDTCVRDMCERDMCERCVWERHVWEMCVREIHGLWHHMVHVWYMCRGSGITCIRHVCTANLTLGDIFASSKLKARTSLLPRFSEKRRSCFELWALIQHSKMSPRVGLAVSCDARARVSDSHTSLTHVSDMYQTSIHKHVSDMYVTHCDCLWQTCIHKHVSDMWCQDMWMRCLIHDTCHARAPTHVWDIWHMSVTYHVLCRHVWYMSDTQTCIRHVSCDARAQTCCVFLSHMTDTNITCVREIHTVCVREIHVICVWETHILWMNEMHVISKTKKTEKCVFLIICKTKHVWRRDTCDMCEGDTHFMNEREEHNM